MTSTHHELKFGEAKEPKKEEYPNDLVDLKQWKYKNKFN